MSCAADSTQCVLHVWMCHAAVRVPASLAGCSAPKARVSFPRVTLRLVCSATVLTLPSPALGGATAMAADDSLIPMVVSPALPPRLGVGAGRKQLSWEDYPLDYETAMHRNRARTDLKLDARGASMFSPVQAMLPSVQTSTYSPVPEAGLFPPVLFPPVLFPPVLFPPVLAHGLQVRRPSLPQLRRPPSRLLPKVSSLPHLRPEQSRLGTRAQRAGQRRSKLEAAAATYDISLERLKRTALLNVEACVRKPGSSVASEAAENLTIEVRRHRFFLPEKAADGLERIEGGKRKKVARREWKLDESIWGPRRQWISTGEFYDTPAAFEVRFDEVFGRALRSGLKRYIERLDGSEEGVVVAVRDALFAQDRRLFPCFDFYASRDGYDGVIGLNDFSQFVCDCNLPDPKSNHLRKADIDRLFIAVDTASKATADEESDGFNRAKALSSDEFVNAIVQLAAMKCALPCTLPRAPPRALPCVLRREPGEAWVAITLTLTLTLTLMRAWRGLGGDYADDGGWRSGLGRGL